MSQPSPDAAFQSLFETPTAQTMLARIRTELDWQQHERFSANE
jgi:hypothetical protein